MQASAGENDNGASSILDDQLAAALSLTGETAAVDFKSQFDPEGPGEWLEIIKDLVAMANSGGGMIAIGLNDDGSPSGADVSRALAIDSADLTNKLLKYTGLNFSAFTIVAAEKVGSSICAIRIGPTRMPMVFTKVGTYEIAPGKQKNAFSVGTVYFRHGSKSEPCTSEDLRAFLDRELEGVRRSWLDGIAKVVDAPAGSRVAILPPENAPTGASGAVAVRLVDDPGAPAYYALPLDTTHPFRQKEVIQQVNKRLHGAIKLNAHDVLCIRRAHKIPNNISFCYTQNFASPRYSSAFVDWIVQQFDQDPGFFEKAKQEFARLKGGA